jgi:hypothetical protein
VSAGVNFAGREYTATFVCVCAVRGYLRIPSRQMSAEERGREGWRKGKGRWQRVARAACADFARSRLRNKRRVEPRSKEDGEPTDAAAVV